MKKSLWSDSAKIKAFAKLNGDIKTDVLVIGGGICGILCAYFLKSAGANCVLAEGGTLAQDITKNTTAKITSQHGAVYADFVKKIGKDSARLYLKANQEAIEEYARLCKNISCDFERKSAFVYSVNDRAKMEKEARALQDIGFDAQFKEETRLPFNISGAVEFKNQAQFNPLKFLAEISGELCVYENTFVREITGNTAVIEKGKIHAKKIIVATHFPFINKHGSHFLKLYQHRSYVSAFENAEALDGMYVDEDDKGFSFRNYGKYLLIGGGGHRTGKKGGAWKEINAFGKKYYKNAKPVYEWATQDCMSLDSIPYIGKYSKNTPDLLVATGFNKWGMTSSMVAAQILRDMVIGKENEYEHIFSPQRSIFKPQLLVNGFEAGVNLLTPVAPRCPHLGCALKWNKNEHSWDCPCHGSRFEKDGKLIDNPATGDLKR